MLNPNNIIEAEIDFVELILNGTKRVLFNDVSLTLESKSTYILLGSNGIGKTTFLNSLLNLLDKRFYRIAGKIFVLGKDILNSSEDEIRLLRKDAVRFIFQDAVNCFDPVKKIGYYFSSWLKDSDYLDQLLEYFLLPKKEIILNYYPYELSGGIAQRLAIIWGIMSEPKLLIFDEPNSALDIPLSVLLSKKLTEITKQYDLSILIVTQDLNFAINTADKIGVLKNNGITEFNNTVDNVELIRSNILPENFDRKNNE